MFILKFEMQLYIFMYNDPISTVKNECYIYV